MKDIRESDNKEMLQWLSERGEKPFRAKQISEWLWKKGASNFEEMTNMSVELRRQLAADFMFRTGKIEQQMQSRDKTTKYTFLFHDGSRVEGVLIPTDKRVTACISTQAGCAMRCAFCATGTMGFIRNLHYSEIFDQFMLLNKKAVECYENSIDNIVYMGMGEPLLNYDNVMRSIALLTTSEGQNMSPSRITLSTAGIINGIKRLADDNVKCGLAVSLHSADEKVRNAIMPVNHSNPLAQLQEALRYYHDKTGNRITFEYLLLAGINDSLHDAELLASYCRAFPVKINLIEYNTTDTAFERSTADNVQRFVQFLESRNMIVNIRKSRGMDIAAACGQLVKNTGRSIEQ